LARPRSLDPALAFAHFCSLPAGAERTLTAVAKHFGVAVSTVTRLAERDRWFERVAEVEQRAHAAALVRLEETIEEMHARHVAAWRECFLKSLDAMREQAPITFPEALKGLETAFKSERLVRGEATSRSETLVDDLRENFERWLEAPGSRPTRVRVLGHDGKPVEVDVAADGTFALPAPAIDAEFERAADDDEHYDP
jgi:hypothetical protein